MPAQTLVERLAEPGLASMKAFHLALQIENIVTSYDDKFDAFAEMVQNSLDALIERWKINEGEWEEPPTIKVVVDCDKNTLSVLDNGCGVDPSDFVEVFKPNRSLKRLRYNLQPAERKGLE